MTVWFMPQLFNFVLFCSQARCENTIKEEKTDFTGFEAGLPAVTNKYTEAPKKDKDTLNCAPGR